MIGIILINYHSENEVLDYLKHEISKISYPYKVVIVNNSSDAENELILTDLLQKDGQVRLDEDYFIINGGSNLGYAKANNLGARFLMDRFPIEHFLFSNADIEIQNGNDIDLLIKRLESSDKIGGIGPRVIGKKGEEQSPHTYIPFCRYIGWYLLKPLKGKVSLLKMKPDKNQKVDGVNGRKCYWVSGCFMLVKAQNFIDAGMFDPYTFLYCEEKILSERFLKNGHQFYFEPVAIIHHNQDDKQTDERKKEMANMIFNNDCYYYQTYRGVPDFLIRFLRMIRKIWN